MLTKVIVMTSPPQEFVIEGVDPAATLIIESISGLSPMPLTLFTGTYSTDGGYYQGRRSNPRNVVMNYKMNPDYANDIAVSDIRESLYRTFLEPHATSDGVTVVFEDDRKPDRYVVGYVEALEADIFAQSTKAQISLLCVDPYLRSTNSVFNSNPSGWTTVPFEYEGTADTGISVQVTVVTANDQVSIMLNDQRMTLVKPTGNFAPGDIITISTVIGERQIMLNGVDVMAMLTADSDWLSLNAPDIVLKAYGDTVGDGYAVITQYVFQPTWWGI